MNDVKLLIKAKGSKSSIEFLLICLDKDFIVVPTSEYIANGENEKDGYHRFISLVSKESSLQIREVI